MSASLKLSRETLGPDLGSGLTVALVSIPEGMAYAMVAGVNPVYGLYTGMVTTIVASLTGSTSLMVVTLTNALALVTGETLAGLGGDVDIRTMFTLTLLVGAIMFILGVLKLGSIIRFVSVEVMSGFVFATALLIVLGQYDELVGYASALEDANKLVKAIDITLHIGEWNLYTTIVGVGSIIVLVVLKRIRPLEKWADVLIIVLSSLFVLVLGWGVFVELVGDIAEVPSGFEALPKPVLPDFSAIPLLIGGAIAAAVVGLAEGSGAGAAYPNPDGSKSDMSRDFSAQGLGNMVGSFFQAMPAGASLSRTGINASGGAQTRWAGAFSGMLLALTLVLIGGATELIPMAGLAGLLMVIGFEIMIREGNELNIAWRVDKVATTAAIATIVVGVFEDLTVAIFTGVVLSLLIYTFESASQVKVSRLVRREDGRWETQPPPEVLPSGQATVLQADGNVYFASIYSIEDLLPAYESTRNAVLIISMRGRESLNTTTINHLEELASKLEASGNKLMLSEMEEVVMEDLKAGELVEAIGEEFVFPMQPVIGASIEEALAAAERWIKEPKDLPAATGEAEKGGEEASE
jgi:SulP family sulfate permease